MIFGGLNIAAIALFVVCFTLLPVLSLRPRKFAILYVSSPSTSSRSNPKPLPAQTTNPAPSQREGVLLSRISRSHPSISLISSQFHARVESFLALAATRRAMQCSARPRPLMQWDRPPDHKVSAVRGACSCCNHSTQPPAATSRALVSIHYDLCYHAITTGPASGSVELIALLAPTINTNTVPTFLRSQHC